MADAACHYVLAGGGGGALLGMLLLYLARRADARNWFIQRAPELPIRLVEPGDDVWIAGEVAGERPLLVPYFGIACFHYAYRVERKVTRTRRRKDGSTETYTTWETDYRASESARFTLVDGEAELEIRAEEAHFADLETTGTEYESSRRRHSARYFPVGGRARAVGLVDAERRFLGRGTNVPLVVTRRERQEYLHAIERSETALRITGLLILWLGLAAVAFGLAGLARWLPAHLVGGPLAIAIVLCLGAGLLPLAFLWGLYTYNTLVAYRTRTQNAWKLIDVDLTNRYDLIPQLVTVLRAACAHERQLFERVAALRAEYLAGDCGQRVAQEGEATRAIGRILALEESYPELTTNQLFRQLRDTLTALEEKIAYDRTFYNENVTEYNTLIERLPHVVIARLGRFEPLPLFRIAEDAKAG